MISITHQKVTFVSLDRRQQRTETRRSSEVYIEAIAHLPDPLAPGFAALCEKSGQ
jgi:hypothetical protein